MRIPLTLAFALSLFSTAAFGSIDQNAVGQSAAQFLDFAGKPVGVVERGANAIWIYPEGRAFLEGGQVVKIDKTAAPRAASKDRLEIAQNELQKRVYSPEYLQMDPIGQLRFLQNFQQRYPAMDLTNELDRARQRFETQREEAEAKPDIVEPEQVAETTRPSRARSRTVFYSSGFGSRGSVTCPSDSPSDAGPPRTTYYSRQEQLFGKGAISPVGGVAPVAPQLDPYR